MSLLTNLRQWLGGEPDAAAIVRDSQQAPVVYQAGLDAHGVPPPSWTPNELEYSWRHSYYFACLNKIGTSAMRVPLEVKRLERVADTGRMLSTANIRRARQQSASVPWKSKRRWLKAKGFELVDVEDQHPLPTLLDRVNQNDTWPEFVYKSMLHLVGTGDCYWELVGGAGGAIPTELYLMQPDRVKIIPDKQAFVGGYVYTVNSQEVRYERDEVLHFRLPHPMNDLYGLSRADVLELILGTDYKRMIYDDSFFRNGTKLGGMLVPDIKDGVSMDYSAFQRAAEQWKATHVGAQNMNKIDAFGFPVKLVETEAKPKDMEFVQMKEQHEHDISAVTGVPRALTGRVEDANRSNMEALLTVFWDTTMVPLLTVFAARMNEDLCSRYGEDLVVEPDFDAVDALSEDVSAKIERSERMVNAGLWTLNEGRIEADSDALDNGDLLKTKVSETWTPVDEIGIPAPEAAPAEIPAEEATPIPPDEEEAAEAASRGGGILPFEPEPDMQRAVRFGELLMRG